VHKIEKRNELSLDVAPSAATVGSSESVNPRIMRRLRLTRMEK